MKKYTVTYRQLPRGLGKMLKSIEPNIADSVKEPHRACTRFIVAYNGKSEPRGVLVWSRRCSPRFGMHNMAFLEDMDVSVRHRGYGELLFKAFLQEVGEPFFLFCMDSNAESFWQHVAKKNKLVVRHEFDSYHGMKGLTMRFRYNTKTRSKE